MNAAMPLLLRVAGLLPLFLLGACGGGGGSPSTDATLSTLSVSVGTLTPAFQPTVTVYDVGPGALAATATVTATTADAGATLTVNGLATPSGVASAPIVTPSGETTVVVRVTAADGATTSVTTVRFIRAGAELSGLVVSTGTLVPAFDPALSEYAIGPGLLDASVRITATAAHPSSAITVQGVPTPSGTPSAALPLPAGDSVIEVVVVATGGLSRTVRLSFVRGRPAAQVGYLKATNNRVITENYPIGSPYVGGMHFGVRVAISGDTLAVGARLEDSPSSGVNGDASAVGAGGSGAVYVFVRDGAGWMLEAYVKASNPQPSDHFGYAVALDGDTLVVGAPNEDSNARGVNGSQSDNSAGSAGAVYVFARSGGVWTQQAYLKASNTDVSSAPGYGDQFGWSVSVSGDTVVVGAPHEDSSATGVGGDQFNSLADGSGAAYVFVRAGTTWSQQAYLKASNTGTADSFGLSVGVSGETVVVGAPNEDSDATGVNPATGSDSAFEAGAAYVFVRSGTTWSQQAYVKASNTRSAVGLGTSVAVAGDTLIAGAPGESSVGTGVNGNPASGPGGGGGAAYVFARSGSTWTQQAFLKPPTTWAGGGFGTRVAATTDCVVVGNQYDWGGASGINSPEPCTMSGTGCRATSGAAYVFVRSGGTTWSQGAYLKASNVGNADEFGASVAISGDTVIVGAVSEASNAVGVGGDQLNNSMMFSGAAYVFR